jgi:hypothetical protein
LGSKVSKQGKYDKKLYFTKNLNMGIKQRRILHWFQKPLRKCEKLLTKKLYAKRVQNWSFSSSILLTWKGFWQIAFSGWTFFQLLYVHGFERSVKLCVCLILIFKNKVFGVIEYICENFVELLECKFARNGLTNFKKILTNILENIIWHLLLVNPGTTRHTLSSALFLAPPPRYFCLNNVAKAREIRTACWESVLGGCYRQLEILA